MKTLRTYINEARAKRNDVFINTDEGMYVEMYGGGWTVEGEWGWEVEENAFDDHKVIEVEELEEGITIITID